MKITQFDKQNLRDLRIALSAAFLKIEEDFGVKIELGNISYQADTFKATIQAVLAQAINDPYLVNVPAAYIQDFKRYTYKSKLLARVKTSQHGATYVVVGSKDSNLIGKPEGQPNGQLFKLPLKFGNYLHGQLIEASV